MQLFDHFWMKISKLLLKKRSNIVDTGAPFCRVEFVPYHFVGWRKPFCSRVYGHTIL